MLFLWPLLIYSEWWYALYSSVKPAYICGWCTHSGSGDGGHGVLWWRQQWPWSVCACVAGPKIPSKEYIHLLPKSFQRICIRYDVFYLLFTLPVSMRLFIFIVVKSIFLPRTFFYSYIIFIFFICSFFVALLLIRCLVCWGFFRYIFVGFFVSWLLSCTLIFD